MRASTVLALCLLSCFAIKAAVAIDATLCSATTLQTCQTTVCDNGRNAVRCNDGNIACNPANPGGETQCCGCRGNACTSCRPGQYCVRSPDASSGWECSRFDLAPTQNQPTLIRLQGLKCALATNDIALLPTFAGALQEYYSSAQNCLSGRFTANDGKSNEEALRFDCQPPESYKRLCSDNKGSLCEVQGYMANWHTFPAGALVANFTTQVCVPNDCRDISYEPTIQNYFDVAGASFCANGTSNSICTTQVRCMAPPATPLAADTQLAKNNEYNAGIIALLVVIAVAVVVGIVLVFVFSKKS